MSATINPEIAGLRERINRQDREISELRGSVQQLDKIVSATTRQSIWQLIALVVSLSAAIVGGLAYQTNMIDRRIDQLERRIEQSDKNTAGRFDDLNARFGDLNVRFEDLSARFEDLKEEVRAHTK